VLSWRAPALPFAALGALACAVRVVPPWRRLLPLDEEARERGEEPPAEEDSKDEEEEEVEEEEGTLLLAAR
jgi:hypothetical protein